MARTRLRGLSIAGIQLGIERPETCPWPWPDGPIADYQCLPREPEVRIGVRVAKLDAADLGGERYASPGWVFEVSQGEGGWRLAMSRRGRRECLAVFDAAFREGEILLSPEAVRAGVFPLEGPLAEWLVLQRTIAGGGLCLVGSARAAVGGACVVLGDPPPDTAGPWLPAGLSVLGPRALVVRPARDRLRLFGTPWSESIDPALGVEAPVREFQRRERTPVAYENRLDPEAAAELLVEHAIVPLCDDAIFDRVLRNARRMASQSVARELGIEPRDGPSPIAGPFPPPTAMIGLG